MSGTTTRIEKGLPLSHIELDDNFKYEYKWKPNTDYKAEMVVSFNFDLYECLIDHTSGSIFETIKWKRYGSNEGMGAGPAGIKYFWKDSTEQGMSSPDTDDMGVRLDLIGRPVYKWTGVFWKLIEDPDHIGTGNTFTLDGPASVVPYTNSAQPSISTVKQALDKLLYTNLNVVLSGGGIYEIGSTVADINFNWIITNGNTVINQILSRISPTSAIIAGPTPGITNYNLIGANITVNTVYNISVQDDQIIKNSTTQIQFLPKIYWGNAVIPGTLNSSFVIGLSNSTLTANRNSTLTANMSTNQYFWICLPTSYGTPTFTVGGFSGGFTFISTLSFTNSSGYVQNYDIWRSDNDNLGYVTVYIT